MNARYASRTSRFLVKPIAAIGSVVDVSYKFGISVMLFAHANVRCVDVRLHCWFLVRHTVRLMELRFCRGLNIITVNLVHSQIVSCRNSESVADKYPYFLQRMQDLPFLLRRLSRDILDPQRALPLVVRARVYLAMILSAMYVVSPVDIIPEALLGIIGLLDDLIVVFMCFLYVAALYRTVLVSRHGGA
ncbi:hypothetical protein SASPL_103534 [Salvia splendens]|uniref:DUF1232 domain-containing protein n=1 Tax=Salvia splendens TaxID=180675 RepID=A0A8X8YJV4_SALSN|nr:hypothetical protein SASPL_103534 [Salvia splendens]